MVKEPQSFLENTARCAYLLIFFFFNFSYLFFFFFKIYLFVFGSAGSLSYGLSLVEASRGYSVVEVHGLLNAVASLVSEQGLEGM